MNRAAEPQPIGVFDSGLGGLTVVREILRERPGERIVYLGDTAHVPYGPRPCDEVRDFSLAIGRYFVHHVRCRAIVVACNTATAAGVDALRVAFPDLPIIGMEPGVKPAAAQTRTGRIAVLATVSTLSADRFAQLVERFGHDITVVTQPCPGWVECVERGDLDSPETRALVARYVTPLVTEGVDTLVLGCTHYPLLRPLIEAVAGPEVGIVDTGPAVARHVVRVVRPHPPAPSPRVSSFLGHSWGEGESGNYENLPLSVDTRLDKTPPLPRSDRGTRKRGERGQGGEGSEEYQLRLLTTASPTHSIATALRILAGISSPLAVQFGSITWKNGELTDDADTASGRTQRP